MWELWEFIGMEKEYSPSGKWDEDEEHLLKDNFIMIFYYFSTSIMSYHILYFIISPLYPANQTDAKCLYNFFFLVLKFILLYTQ
jgi:hypothetical protein